MRNKLFFLCGTLALILVSCQKQDAEIERPTIEYDDAAYFLDGLVKKVGEEYLPLHGILTEGGILIPAVSVFEAERHFRSLLPPEAKVQEEMNSLVWTPDDEKNIPQGKVVFSVDIEGPAIARVSLPASCFPESIRSILYLPAMGLLGEVNPSVREDLEDNYFYGAIVDISDHGCGSGKFVVFKEYDFSNGSPGMAVRVDDHRWTTEERNIGDNGGKVYGRASCLSTLKKAGEIFRSDRSILSKQFKNAGCTILDQHYGSSTTTWNGWHYYYCLHNDECNWIGPIHDTDFYECWIYWFKPQGDGILFW